jgi:hypothetical protein
MKAEATQVFGTDTKVVNDLVNQAQGIWNAGPSQQGWSAAESNAINSQIINNAAVSGRNVQSAVGNMASAVGGGRAGVGGSGALAATQAGIAESVEAQKSGQLTNATIQNYQQGNQNWQNAGKTLESAPSVFNNTASFNTATQTGLNANMANAQAADAASNWWVKPVEGLVGAGLNMATGGLSSMATGGSFFGGTGGGGNAGNPQYMPLSIPGSAGGVEGAPQGAFPGSVPAGS